MVELITVCTGNICRSPLAAQLLQTRLADLGPRVTSAGTRGLAAAPMTRESAYLAQHLGVPAEVSAAHRSRFLQESDLHSPDLVLAMAREHRRDIAELAPARLRHTFTAREFARLAVATPDADLLAAADGAGAGDGDRLRAAAEVLAARRGLTPPPADPGDDDVVDPFRREWEVYQRSAAQLVPAVEEVVRVVRLVCAPR
ncbi:low molecular weight phosphatase family protein [Microbacterium sp. SSW1-59]|uniref:low molecular weight phosphatase family protein n=1 Tax=Microbacterium xanthum TaxID=3079794 RepID=UPI002AD287C6|nr:low molecular weight phosphatase family protein [Microbacterium sp. SSW1-59]MDZ8201344.1 low molecular weight phosphatase family protein [Microbacterium sp. SSW1-59]